MKGFQQASELEDAANDQWNKMVDHQFANGGYDLQWIVHKFNAWLLENLHSMSCTCAVCLVIDGMFH